MGEQVAAGLDNKTFTRVFHIDGHVPSSKATCEEAKEVNLVRGCCKLTG